MPKRSVWEVRRLILEILSDSRPHSYSDLERKANTNWQTIRNHCKELLLFNAVTIINKKIIITKEGILILKKIKSQKFDADDRI